MVIEVKIRKILNNNAVTALNYKGEEIVLMGLGVAFQKKSGDEIDNERIERIFTLQNKEVSERLKTILNEISIECLSVADEIVKNAEKELEKKLDECVFLALADHINFAISRYKQGTIVKNPMRWEVRRFYKKEYEIALNALNLIEEKLKVKFEEDEAAHITLHIVNAELSVEMPEVVDITNMIDGILNVIKYHFKITFDEDSLNYYRLVTHLKFFAERILTRKESDEYDDYLFNLLKERYNEAYECVNRIKIFIQKKYNFKISNEEMTFLIVHVQRIIDKKI